MSDLVIPDSIFVGMDTTKGYLDTLKQARKRKGMTLEDLGGKLGKSRETMGNYERGVSYPTTDVFRDWCSLLDVKIGFIQEI